MFLKKNFYKLGLILLLTSSCPIIGQAYIYDYKGGVRNNLIMGGSMGYLAGVSAAKNSYKYSDYVIAGFKGSLDIGAETQFNKYFSLVSTVGLSTINFQALEFKEVARIYLGTPHLFIGLGPGLSFGGHRMKLRGFDNMSKFSVMLNGTAEAGVSISFNTDFSLEILANFTGVAGWLPYRIDNIAESIKLNLNVKV